MLILEAPVYADKRLARFVRLAECGWTVIMNNFKLQKLYIYETWVSTQWQPVYYKTAAVNVLSSACMKCDFMLITVSDVIN